MPIFQDDFGSRGALPAKPIIRRPPNSRDNGTVVRRKESEESIRTDLCEGPVADSFENEREETTAGLCDYKFPAHDTSDRVELIERLKRGESPSWLLNRKLHSPSRDQDRSPRTPSHPGKPTTLLPSPEIQETTRPSTVEQERNQAGLQIERPRSALHSGDFTEGQNPTAQNGLLQPDLFLGRPEHRLATSPPQTFSPFQLDTRFPPPEEYGRSRAPSLSSSYSSSFIFKAPTSPLVHSESNEELDLSSGINPIDITPYFQRNPRRHTLQTSSSLLSTPSMPSASFGRPLPHLRRDNTYPYQAHQPRRSLTSNQFPPSASSPQTPAFARSRRTSYTSDSSPLHASMVGSYEESILRGRMSTTPSKPLDFVAQIGVLGLGKCKSNLRCPAHVTVPFPAVFYSYETTTHGRASKSEDGPSPYVGQIDLENSLPNQEAAARDHKRKRNATAAGRVHIEDIDMVDGPIASEVPEQDIRRVEKQKRRSTSPRAPPGGSYRIPEKGQLQIIIKNPNKTAVKLFLVPYDLAGMEPGTKTFIRQRSYSAGPIIDMPLSALPPGSARLPDQSTLRYLIHLHICSPSRGRFYLYKSIRVVFANRVPDGKEKLRNEISLPEPRFSIYKPGRDSILGLPLPGDAGASLAADKAFRRRSSGFNLGHSSRNLDSMDGIALAHERGSGSGAGFDYGPGASTTPIHPIPFSLLKRSAPNYNDQPGPEDVQSPSSSKSSQPPMSRGSGSMSWNSESTGISGYDKLHKGDAGYGGSCYTGLPDGKQIAEGLLAKKFRDLGVGLRNLQDELDDI